MKHVNVHTTSGDIRSLSHVMVGSMEFMDQLKIVSQLATERFFVQVMTFEGDAAGQQLIDLIIRSEAREKVLVVDHYSDVVINDTLLHIPPGLFSMPLWKEYRATHDLLKTAQSNGIRVVKTNPIGALYHRYPLRNHKKSIVIDDHLFLGGINFSDHNFSWHDMMVHFDSKTLADAASTDILANASGNSTCGVHGDSETTLVFLNRYSESEYRLIVDWIRSATRSITVYSPYLSDPFLSVLKSVSNRIKVTFITPELNNKGMFSEYLKRLSHEGWFELMVVPVMMSHLKAILIDDEALILGSSNFDFISYLFEEEVMVKTTSPEIIEAFLSKVKVPMETSTQRILNPDYHRFKSYIPEILWKLLRSTDPKSTKLYLNS